MSDRENAKLQAPSSVETPNPKLQRNAKRNVWSTPYSGGKGDGRSEADAPPSSKAIRQAGEAEKEERSAGTRRSPGAARVLFACFIIPALAISLICGCSSSNPYGVTKMPPSDSIQ